MARQLYLDCDGVLADFDKGATAVLGLPPHAYEKRHGLGRFWQKLATAPDFYFGLPLMPDAMELFEAVRHLKPVILTGLPRGNWAADQKVRWAAEYFPGTRIITTLALLAALAGVVSCSDDPWVCLVADGTTPDYLEQIGCEADFLAIASRPLDATIPGARSAKTIVDREGGNTLTYQNTNLYVTHYEFASAHLSGNGRPIVEMLAYFACISSHSVASRRTCASLSSAEVMTPFSYETCAMLTLSRASSSAFSWVDTTSAAAPSAVHADSSSSRALSVA